MQFNKQQKKELYTHLREITNMLDDSVNIENDTPVLCSWVFSWHRGKLKPKADLYIAIKDGKAGLYFSPSGFSIYKSDEVTEKEAKYVKLKQAAEALEVLIEKVNKLNLGEAKKATLMQIIQNLQAWK